MRARVGLVVDTLHLARCELGMSLGGGETLVPGRASPRSGKESCSILRWVLDVVNENVIEGAFLRDEPYAELIFERVNE